MAIIAPCAALPPRKARCAGAEALPVKGCLRSAPGRIASLHAGPTAAFLAATSLGSLASLLLSRRRAVARLPRSRGAAVFLAAASGDSAAASGAECRYEEWRGHRVRCATYRSDGATGAATPEIVLVHGFGGSIEYWRRTVPALVGAGYTVHALDLLGLGFSDKPSDVRYSIELWASQVADYTAQLTGEVVLIGNSFGSLISLEAAAAGLANVRGIAMLNCGVGMNNKNVAKSLKFNALQSFLISIVLGVVDLVLKSPVLDVLFSNFANAKTVGAVLKDLYLHNPAAVDDELVDAFVAPGKTQGAVEVLRQIYTGSPGRTPMEVFATSQVDSLPMKVIWGDKDQLTPIDGDVGSFLSKLSAERENLDFEIISAGHVPHDDNPEAVNRSLVAWLGSALPSSRA